MEVVQALGDIVDLGSHFIRENTNTEGNSIDNSPKTNDPPLTLVP